MLSRFARDSAYLNDGDPLVKPWIGYEEPVGGLRAAQPDLLVLIDHRIVVFEIKLSRCEEGFLQLEQLYFPLVKAIWNLPVAGVLVFRNPTRGYLPHAKAPTSLRRALLTPSDSISEWHLLI